MGLIYFTADLHFGHKNILTLAHRNFNSIKEHDEAIINAINETVTTADHLYILGDLGFHKDLETLREYLMKVKCRNIHVVKGNHDNMQHLVQLKREHIISDVKEMQTVQWGGKSIFCCHYPMREWPGFYKGHYMAFGHTHATLPQYKKSIDVGIDNIGIKPIEFEALIELIDSDCSEDAISKDDELINKHFPDLNAHFFISLCTGNKEIRNKIAEVLLRDFRKE